jgi:hypothetical protein
MRLRYIEGTKYQVAEDFIVLTPITGEAITDDWFVLAPNGALLVRKGFGWDGASGPTFDSQSSMSASLVHDVFCLCMRDGRLSYNKWQDAVNQFFEDMCRQAGMWGWRAKLWHTGVELGDAGNPKQGPDRKVLEAP